MRLSILGGAGGIGRALARAALDAGHTVTVLDLAASLDRHPPDGPAIEVDASVPATLERAFDDVGQIDGFVNLCGFMAPPRPIGSYDQSLWDEVLTGNLSAAFHASRFAVPHLADGGAMVHVGSGLGHNARPGFGAYAVAKAGISALTRQLALDCAPRIRVNCVAPSAVETAFLRGGTGRSDERGGAPIDRDAYAATIPLGRIAEAEDVTGPILFLLSDAARYMTGQVLHVNGGAYMP
ncbi:SDR family NAD(P)-dependent oxidoreductase [Cognatishimia sp. F0-27]|uniref:SDR family NAD(P)-dependent oxidoreductase n=1 Tax=Cognatishimia sp. F0-27 TaxID=2816855 RepID=UPI001D0CD00F|nr:SDR family oxidoreductase [Cognatishimia sp. F0-27]MCC1493479.1 SDR family oxidoreductase [Cognatishimia sp. F0-27]